MADSKELGLGVIFTATIAGFADQLTAIQKQLETFATKLEQFGKTGEKAMEGLAKATTKIDKASADAAKTAKEAADKQAASSTASAKASEGLAASTEKATVAAKSHGQSLSAVRESMKGLDAATQSQIASSKMSLPVYEALQKRLAANSSEAGGFKKALASLAMVPGQTALGFSNLTNALIKNEKAMLESKSSIGNLRDQLSGSNNLPSNVKNWSSSINRAEMAHATLNKELYKSGDVVQQAGKTIAETTRSLTALEKQYGADNVSKYREQIGSTIKTMGEFKSALVANQTAQIAANTHTIAAEKAITATQTALNAMNGSGDAWRKGVNESAVATQFLRGRLADANGQILQSGKAFTETSQAVDKMGTSFTKSLSAETINTIRGQIGQTIGTLNEYQQALLRASNRGEEVAKVNARAGEAFRELGINSAASGKAIAFVADQVAKGNMTYESASRVIKNHSDAIIKADKATTALSEGQSRLSASFGSLMARTDEYGTKAKSLYDNFTNGNKNLADTRILMQGVNADYQKSVTATTSLIDASTNLNSKYRELLATTNTYNGTAARQMISNLQNGGTEAKVLGDTFQRMNQDLKEHTASVNKWNDTIKNIPTSNIAATAEVNRLQAAINSGTMTTKQATESINNFTKSIDNKTKAVKSSQDSFRAFASGIIGGGAAANVAAGYFTNLAVAIKSLAAWIPAAMIIGAFTEGIMGAISQVKEFDQALKNLQAISQGTDTEVAMLGEELIKLSNSTKYSASEISKGAIFIAQAGFTASETMQVIGAAAKLAQGTMSDMAMSADLLTTILRVFQKDGREAAKIADMLAVAANKSKTDIQGLRIAFNYLGPVAKATGMSLQEALASIMALSNAGIRMSTIGTGMRQVISRLENPTAKLKEAMQEAGLSIVDFNFKTHNLGQVAENMARIVKGDAGNALKFFGERAGNTALILSNLGPHLNTLVGYLGEMGAASAMAEKQTEGLGVKLAILGNRFQNMFIKFTEGGFTNVLKGILSGITALIDGLTVLAENSFVKFVAIVGIVQVSIGLLTMSLRALVAVGLSSWAGTTVANTLGMIRAMGIYQTVLTLVAGSQYQVTVSTSILAVSFNALTASVAVVTGGMWSLSAAGGVLAASLKVIQAAILTVLRSSMFWIVSTTALVLWLTSSSNAHEKETQILQKKSMKYQEGAISLKNYAKDLRNLGEEQAKGNDVQLQNLVLIKTIREKYPELSAALLKSNVSLQEQADIVEALSEKYTGLADSTAKVTTERIIVEMNKGREAAKYYQEAIDKNTTAWEAFKGVFDFDAPAERLKVFDKIVWETVKGWVGFGDVAGMLSDGVSSNLMRGFKTYENLAAFISEKSPEMRKQIIDSLPAEDMRTRVTALVAVFDQYQAMLKARADYTEDTGKAFKNNIQELGADWAEYYLKQDKAGADSVMKAAENTQKLIKLEEKKYEKSKDGIAYNENVARITQEGLDKIIEIRTKQVDKMLKLMDDFYKSEEKAIKASAENQLQNNELLKKKEIMNLDERLMGEENYLKAKVRIEQTYLDKSKEISDKEAQLGLEAARKTLENQKTFLALQTGLKGDEELKARSLVAEQAYSDKVVEIYKLQLGQYKTLIGEKISEVERYRKTAIKAEDDILKIQEQALKKKQDIESQKRSALQLTMLDSEKAADNIKQFSELMIKGDQAFADASAASSEKVKEIKLKAAQDYYEKAQSLNSSLEVQQTGIVGKMVVDEKSTQTLRIDNLTKLETAFTRVTDKMIADEQAKKVAAETGAVSAKENADKLIKVYDDLSVKLKEATTIQLDNSKALLAIDDLAKKIFDAQKQGLFNIVINFRGKASPEDEFGVTLEGVKASIAEFVTNILSIPLNFIVRFLGDNGSGQITPITTMISTVYMQLKDLAEKITGLKPTFTITTVYKTEGVAPTSSSSKQNYEGETGESGNAGAEGFEEGGSVPGSGTGDTVPTMLTPGEFVVQAPVVKGLGEGFFNFVNGLKSFSAPKFNMSAIPAYAGGGAVKPSHEMFTINLQAGSAKLPLQVVGNPATMRTTIKLFERELSKMKLSRA